MELIVLHGYLPYVDKIYLTKNIDQTKNKCIALNSKESFNLDTGNVTKKYERINHKEKEVYVKQVLSKIKYSYEFESVPNVDLILKLIPKNFF